ncbi:OmpA family protein [Parasulfuritortus cantonensis]|uniref:OmpA family protein n=1 Tax=Parasulfuritortus cantonensis TaxID=2528202 RepID=A0A4R1BFR8_9PROT|nr:OmpA family protein [Parasulfuritortus cantonensis]TCJ15974.1 OmpA family protein [Parasulfuritortus cantonensis]
MAKSSIALIALAMAATGCATKDYVNEYVGEQVTPVNKRLDVVESRAAVNEAGVQALGKRADGTDASLKDQSARIDGASRTAKEALERALSAGQLAEGKLLYEVVLTDDTLRFGLESADLSPAAKQLLDSFAAKLKAENRNVFIEIQGHTDTTGNKAYNLKLGEQRAEMVKRYLNMNCGIPLHRMSTISYGPAAPVADNKTRAGRIQNRRVVLVVLH